MQRLGLCCLFRKEKISFRSTTVAYVKGLSGEDFFSYISTIILHNVQNLLAAVLYCSEHGIGDFRVTSKLFPLYTHPELGYKIDDLPDRVPILKTLRIVKRRARAKNFRLTFHPDQFVVLSSPSDDVVARSIQELEYHGFMADLIGADVINLHGGGGYGDKEKALERFVGNFGKLSSVVRERLTLENDDRVYTPSELLPLCQSIKIPLVYDVHHHRCLKDGLSVEEATTQALATWNREPLFHVSSPKGGWSTKRPQFHDDFIDPRDVPTCWRQIDPLTIEVEAKAKEVAVLRLRKSLLKADWGL